jgi:hypothetical protein
LEYERASARKGCEKVLWMTISIVDENRENRPTRTAGAKPWIPGRQTSKTSTLNAISFVTHDERSKDLKNCAREICDFQISKS